MVTIMPVHKSGNNVDLEFAFNGQWQSSPSKTFSKSSGDASTVSVEVRSSDGKHLQLPEVDFFWNTHTPLQHSAGDYRKGQKGAVSAK